MNPYELLLEKYVADLTAAKHYTETWWASLLEAETRRLGDSGSAEESLNQRWPFGPTTHPRVVAVYRKYYRACTALTNELDAIAEAKYEEEDTVESEEDWGEVEEDEDDEFPTVETSTFLIDQLCDVSDELGEFLLHMVFIPIETADENLLAKDLEEPDAVERLIRALVNSKEGEQP